MKLRLLDALHARPANLFVRLASQFPAEVELRFGTRRADGKNILDVLALGAAKGEEIEINARGEGEGEALAALVKLIERGFDGDLVPEAGAAAVDGIAVGVAFVVAATAPAEPRVMGSKAEERARLAAAIAHVERDLEELLRVLPPQERELFLPEREILRALAPLLMERAGAGESAESAVAHETEVKVMTDLLADARSRLLERLRGNASPSSSLTQLEGDRVLVTEELTPSLVASLPAHVVGIVVSEGENASSPRGLGHTSHAAILARGRDIPLVFVAHHVVAAISDGDVVVIDTTASRAQVWVSPSEALVDDARARRDARIHARAEGARASIAHLPVCVRVNVGSIHDEVPEGAEGIGLFRTELAHAGRASPPTETEQLATIAAVARKAKGRLVVVRLFDAGGDKPLEWLSPPDHAPDARGIELLFLHDAVIGAQLRALARARASGADVRVLLPLVRSAADVETVRARSSGALPVGAMIETPDAVRDAASIALVADFICIGTNDLTALTLGLDRADASLTLDPRVLALVARILEAAHAHGRTVTVCGEIAANPRGARVLVGMGVDALSVTPSAVASVRAELSTTTLEDCQALARAAMQSDSL